jgi:hypothetical protein
LPTIVLESQVDEIRKVFWHWTYRIAERHEKEDERSGNKTVKICKYKKYYVYDYVKYLVFYIQR